MTLRVIQKSHVRIDSTRAILTTTPQTHGAILTTTAQTNDESSCQDELDPDLDIEEEDVNLGDAVDDKTLQYRGESEAQDPDVARRASRQKKYEEEKENLVKEMVEILKMVNKSKAMETGAKVQTRKKDPVTKSPTKGVIVKKVYNMDGSSGGRQKKKFSWKVRLESGAKELFVS